MAKEGFSQYLKDMVKYRLGTVLIIGDYIARGASVIPDLPFVFEVVDYPPHNSHSVVSYLAATGWASFVSSIRSKLSITIRRYVFAFQLDDSSIIYVVLLSGSSPFVKKR